MRVDAQGRLVLPKGLRDLVVAAPGAVMVRQTADGLLLTRTAAEGVVTLGEDGLPVLSVGRRVTVEEVAQAIDHDRAQR
ncbi:hypothetical protein BH23ACT9_BH23ACT9_14490 [soil metagenome]